MVPRSTSPGKSQRRRRVVLRCIALQGILIGKALQASHPGRAHVLHGRWCAARREGPLAAAGVRRLQLQLEPVRAQAHDQHQAEGMVPGRAPWRNRAGIGPRLPRRKGQRQMLPAAGARPCAGSGPRSENWAGDGERHRRTALPGAGCDQGLQYSCSPAPPAATTARGARGGWPLAVSPAALCRTTALPGGRQAALQRRRRTWMNSSPTVCCSTSSLPVCLEKTGSRASAVGGDDLEQLPALHVGQRLLGLQDGRRAVEPRVSISLSICITCPPRAARTP